ncbi:MAG: membrane protein insertion efficiency factor YidD [Deltaproteobacteria bacterium]|nr:membrane protein insertion efficiency factor YidD [Deltaproteobacteria bacterium]
MKKIFLLIIRSYQYIISPFLGAPCRFIPTCSDYAFQAVSKYGVVKGSFLSIKRICRCHPFNSGGIDPVP